MDASFHRFDLLITRSPSALLTILSAFADLSVVPVSVKTRQHMNSLQSVTIVLKQLADTDARGIEKQLRHDAVVQAISLEHVIT